MSIVKIVHIVCSLFLIAACNPENKKTRVESNVPSPALINYGVVATYPHDTTSFTEGLVFHDGKLYESTGSPDDLPSTRSVVGPLNLKTGRIETKVELDRSRYFGEGITFLNGKLYHLTYQTRVGFIYDANSFEARGKFSFPSKEGWGLTTDGDHLIMSDGTDKLTYLDSASLGVLKEISIYDDKGPVRGINELEYIEGYIFANVYTTDYLIQIDPTSGRVVGNIDLSSLAQDARAKNKRSLDLNGIAYNLGSRTTYVTGKFWPAMFEIKFSVVRGR
jgi:glutamine cyclotransferase